MDKNYILIIGWVAVMAMLSVLTAVKRVETVCGKKEYRWRPVWAVVTFLPLIIWCGYRGNIGDTWAYKKSFSEMPVSLGGIASYMATVKKDKGFYFVSAVIKCIVGNHVNIYFIVLAAIQAGVLIYVYRKYSSRYLVSFFLFIASTDYISWLFNGIRQFLAVTITFIGIKFILDKKYAKAIILILIASLMHQSALLVIGLIFIFNFYFFDKSFWIHIIDRHSSLPPVFPYFFCLSLIRPLHRTVFPVASSESMLYSSLRTSHAHLCIAHHTVPDA